MSSFDRRKFLAASAAVMAASACGFSPVYAPSGAAAAARGRLEIGPIEGLLGFKMRERLAFRLGPADRPDYVLDVTLEIDSEGLAITADADITRYNLTGTAIYAIRRKTERQALSEGSVRSFAAYNTIASPYATRVAERDARSRLVLVLADMIAARVAATADRWLP